MVAYSFTKKQRFMQTLEVPINRKFTYSTDNYVVPCPTTDYAKFNDQYKYDDKQ